MKTNIRTIIGIAALGVFGFVNINAAFVNINATAGNKKVFNANFVPEIEKSLTIESWMLENAYWTPKSVIDTMEAEKALEVEEWMTNQDIFFKSESSKAFKADYTTKK